MNDGFPLLVAHNIQTHALLFRLINHPKDCPAAYYYLWQNMVVEFSDLDASYSFRYLNGNHEGNLQFIIEDVCDAIQTLGPLLDGRPTQNN
ncbi:hypothetical protein [Undibacterium danionis]|uniref:Uncharacterized protein n=1 Tax=Undibacterium danionis TaxID=1812100 RepID=A0ABV6IE15_9BURK